MLPITTERLIIRRLVPTDLHDLLAYQTHPENRRYMAIEPFTEEKAASFIEKQANLEVGDEGGWMGLAIEHRDSGRMIGEVGLYIQPSPRSEADLGFALHPDYQGHGYATVAARALLAYAFETRHLHRVTAGCDARNIASFRLMERLGMRREAHFRESQLLDGVWQDSYAYALLQREWQAQQKA